MRRFGISDETVRKRLLRCDRSLLVLHRRRVRKSLPSHRPTPDPRLLIAINAMAERCNERVAAEVLPINVAYHADLEALLLGFNYACNQRRSPVLDGISPTTKVTERRR
ncbi:hypothetical protein JK193_14295 [Gluconobacter wancherniae]|uniref:hypothetical protein n=1 Tax=Gluconobacter wancherniae TaxID=1307955 RepID=UPI001B8DA274|nr:hypothetical protein [Gluconobacter wancherniae]MBS1095784.1 hypothetical protein [Gluconobacter wancherniae]